MLFGLKNEDHNYSRIKQPHPTIHINNANNCHTIIQKGLNYEHIK